MSSAVIFTLTFFLSLFLFAASSLVPPRTLRQLLVFAFVLSVPFLIGSLITLAISHYTRSRTRRTTSLHMSFWPCINSSDKRIHVEAAGMSPVRTVTLHGVRPGDDRFMAPTCFGLEFWLFVGARGGVWSSLYLIYLEHRLYWVLFCGFYWCLEVLGGYRVRHHMSIPFFTQLKSLLRLYSDHGASRKYMRRNL